MLNPKYGEKAGSGLKGSKKGEGQSEVPTLQIKGW
jgi:hypothetical protein